MAVVKDLMRLFVESVVETRLLTLERRKIAAASWRDFGAIIAVRDLD